MLLFEPYFLCHLLVSASTPSPLPLLAAKKACWRLFRRPSPQLKSQKHLQKSKSSCLVCSHSLPVTLVGHSPALPAQILALFDLQLCEVKFPGLFWGCVFHSCYVSFIYSSSPPSPAQWQLGTRQVVAPTAARQKQLLFLFLLTWDSFDLTTSSLSFS